MAQTAHSSRANEPKNRSATYLLLFALVLGVAAFFLNWRYLSSRGTEVTVLKVTAEIPAGAQVGNHVEEVTMITNDAEQINKIFISSRNRATFLQMPVAERLAPGQLLTQRAFRVEGNTTLSLEVDENAVPMSVANSSLQMLCFVGPGSLVDIWSVPSTGEAEIVRRNVKLLSVGDGATAMRSSQCRDASNRDITVAVPIGDVADVFRRLQRTGRDGVHLTIAGSTGPQFVSQTPPPASVN